MTDSIFEFTSRIDTVTCQTELLLGNCFQRRSRQRGKLGTKRSSSRCCLESALHGALLTVRLYGLANGTSAFRLLQQSTCFHPVIQKQCDNVCSIYQHRTVVFTNEARSTIHNTIIIALNSSIRWHNIHDLQYFVPQETGFLATFLSSKNLKTFENNALPNFNRKKHIFLVPFKLVLKVRQPCVTNNDNEIRQIKVCW